MGNGMVKSIDNGMSNGMGSTMVNGMGKDKGRLSFMLRNTLTVFAFALFLAVALSAQAAAAAAGGSTNTAATVGRGATASIATASAATTGGAENAPSGGGVIIAVDGTASSPTTEGGAAEENSAKGEAEGGGAADSDAADGELADGETADSEEEQRYNETDGVINLTLNAMFNRIRLDNEEYKVLAKRAEIYKRRLAFAMSDKHVAENLPPPNVGNPTSRLNWEKQRHTAWRTAELELQKHENDLENKYNSIKSSLKSQYISILDMQRSIKTYSDEMTKLESNILQTETRINVGQAKQSDIDSLLAQKQKIEADMAARERDIDLAKLNLKSDLGIDFMKDIELADYMAVYRRFNDRNIEEKIAEAVENSFSLYYSKQRLEIQREERAMMILFDRDGVFMISLQDNEVSIKQTEYEIISTRYATESGFWSSYYSILNQEDKIEIERVNVKLAEESLRVTSALLAQGMARQIDEQDDRINLENAKITLETAINDYMRMAEDFESSLK